MNRRYITVIQLCCILVTMILYWKTKCLQEIKWQKYENANCMELFYSFIKFGLYFFLGFQS